MALAASLELDKLLDNNRLARSLWSWRSDLLTLFSKFEEMLLHCSTNIASFPQTF
jgi:hypothetical protein